MNDLKGSLNAQIAAMLVAGFALHSISTARADSAAGPPVPTCDRKYGTLAVKEPEDNWWTQMNLDSPAALIKVYVAQSQCFTLVDRGKGLAAAQAERALAASGEERVGSNVGKGQMKAADFVLIPDIATATAIPAGTNIGGALGGLLGHGIGAVVGGISLKSKTADVVLTLTDVRSTEQVSLQQGHAKKTDIGFGGGGFGGWAGGFAAAGASTYANTEIGQVVAQAYLDAYAKMVADVKAASTTANPDNTQQSVSVVKPSKMYTNADLKSAVVRDLDPGMTLYPTGEKVGVWWKVNDELGNAGWVVSTTLQLAR